jgi:siroheme synthase
MIAGQSADFSLLDYAGMARDLLTAGPGEASLLAARATAAMLKRMVIAGDDVVVEGRLARIDLDDVHRELDAQARHGVQDFLNWQQVAQRMREKLRGFYAAGLHACG